MSARMWAMAVCLLATAPGVAFADDGGFLDFPEGTEEATESGAFFGGALDAGTPLTGTASRALDAGSDEEASEEADPDAAAAAAAARAAAAEAAAVEADRGHRVERLLAPVEVEPDVVRRDVEEGEPGLGLGLLEAAERRVGEWHAHTLRAVGNESLDVTVATV